jgi:hypothetical protein
MAFSHPLTGDETNQVERTLIAYGAYFGVALLAVDGIDSRERLDTLMKRLVWAGVFMALVGIFQFIVKIDPYAHLPIPGFREWIPPGVTVFGVRSGFERSLGTSEQPIEYSAADCRNGSPSPSSSLLFLCRFRGRRSLGSPWVWPFWRWRGAGARG